MASTINGTSTGNGGLISTGDDSGILNIQTNETTAIAIDASQRAAFVAGTAALPAITTTGDTNTGIFFPAADTIAFAEGGAESMRIDSSGRFCINNTATIDGSRLSIQMSSGDNAMSLRSFDSSTSVMMMQFYTLANTRIGFIQTVSGSSTTYSTSSDYRLKESIAPMTGALAKVAQLKPATYKWKSNGLLSQGFIAHELAEIVPECVTGTKDEVDADGNPVYQGIDTSFLVATLTAAIQEQQALITAQAETINALTARVVALEGQ